MGQNVQVVWEKFARYFEVEPRYVPLTKDRYVLGVPEALKLIDANTIGVVGILGSTYTGEYEPIEQLNDAIDQLNTQTNWNVPIHVDAASGGFVAPFTQPQLRWDFRLSNVKSINTSGHKYGLVYPGIGWVIWRDKQDLPKISSFTSTTSVGINLPSTSTSLNPPPISSASTTFPVPWKRRLPRHHVQPTTHLRIPHYRHRKPRLLQHPLKTRTPSLVTFSIKNPEKTSFSVFDLSAKLRERGWIVPAYTLAPNADDIAVLRIVVKESMSRDMADLLINDLNSAIQFLSSTKPQTTTNPKTEPRVC